jgi:hypothetical protein
MAACDYCGTTILFGGVTDGEDRYCNQRCHQSGASMRIVNDLPQDVVERHIHEVHEGDCPKCNGPGPVDVHTTHTVYSLLFMTFWNSTPQISCRSCGTKSKLFGIVKCGLFGWWGFPWGLIMTPVQLIRNISGLFAGSGSSGPSAQFRKLIRKDLAQRIEEKAGHVGDDVPPAPKKKKKRVETEEVIEDFEEA